MAGANVPDAALTLPVLASKKAADTDPPSLLPRKSRGGCTSPPLTGFYNPWAFAGSVITRDPTGTGGVLYVAEYGFTNSFIGILNIASDGTNCTLTESSASEIADPQSSGLLSLSVYPPRPF